ncbi:MAG TPA: ADOP family duplicated permease [Vicinamibacterales bacterium]|nr:ADOP family duplicated permease [Vicinamibacterales bacterium]
MTTLKPPPASARRLLCALLPAGLRDDIAANLDDLHAARARAIGQWRADAWYCRQAVTFPVRFRLADVALPHPFSTRTTLMRSFFQDLRYAFRLHRARPGFAAVAILSLAIGIGLNTAIFSVVDGVLLRPSPWRDLDRLVMVWETDRNTGTTREPASLPDFIDVRRDARTLEALGAVTATEVNLTPDAGDPVRLAAIAASHDVLPLLGIEPIAGRVFTAEEDRAGGPRVLLISEGLWTRLYDRDAGVIGREMRVNDRPFTVIGVVPEQADFGVLQILGAAAYSRSFADRGTRVRVDVWAPMQPNPNPSPSSRGNHPLFMLGKLAAGRTAAEAHQEVTSLAADLERRYRDTNAARGAFVEPLGDVIFGPSRPALITLIVAVGLVLMVACVNVANLLLARGAGRQREVAVRAALGAGSWRILRQFLVESMALSVTAGALGVAFAYGAVSWLVAMGPANVPRLGDVSIDLRVLIVMLIVSMVVGVLFGIVPALQAIGIRPRSALAAESTRSSTGSRERRRIRSILVVAEVALAVVLVAAAGLLIRSFWHIRAIDPGFQSAGVVKAEFQLPASRYPTNAGFPNFPEMHAFTRAVVDRAASLPGVASAAIAGSHPLDPGFTSSFVIVGREAEAATQPEISVRRVTPRYFDTVGLRVKSGRVFLDSDTTTGAPVAIVNEAAVAKLFPNLDPIGHEIGQWGARRRIVGVVSNELFQGIAAPAPIAVYYPLSQAPSFNGAGVLLVKTAGMEAAAMMPAVTRVIRDVDPALAVFGVEALDETLAQSIGERRFTTSLLSLFAAMALVLAAIGIHGVLSLGVSERVREIGIRMALGARAGDVRAHVLGEGLALAASGVAIGFGGALVLTQYLTSLLYSVAPSDPATFAAVGAMLLGVAVCASYLPARRATQVDPNDALRAEA